MCEVESLHHIYQAAVMVQDGIHSVRGYAKTPALTRQTQDSTAPMFQSRGH